VRAQFAVGAPHSARHKAARDSAYSCTGTALPDRGQVCRAEHGVTRPPGRSRCALVSRCLLCVAVELAGSDRGQRSPAAPCQALQRMPHPPPRAQHYAHRRQRAPEPPARPRLLLCQRLLLHAQHTVPSPRRGALLYACCHLTCARGFCACRPCSCLAAPWNVLLGQVSCLRRAGSKYNEESAVGTFCESWCPDLRYLPPAA